ncbi:hypothetical protein Sgou_32530 [Streptomyces gougerotii]|uniref:Uncharacterized protein n=1 Tax=Streptomyces gougerotii TaxID=53448 RepID=A0ABQ1D876_9ACTN|nr:hypothetical protein Sgou_32530 [Streptomyces gougerotii]
MPDTFDQPGLNAALGAAPGVLGLAGAVPLVAVAATGYRPPDRTGRVPSQIAASRPPDTCRDGGKTNSPSGGALG